MRRHWPLESKNLVPVLAAAIALFAVLRLVPFAWRHLSEIEGWEAEAIARSIVSGHGFSFSGDNRWLWDKSLGDPTQFYPTAWVDPVYVYLLAGAHWVFGQYAYAAMTLLSLACFAGIFACVYSIGRRIAGPLAGLLAVLLLGLHRGFGYSLIAEINNTAVSTLAFTFGVLSTVRYMEAPNLRRGTILGLSLGLTVLACPAATYFSASLMVLLAVFHMSDLKSAVPRLLAVAVVAGLVLAPWAIRNYATFGEIVLVRNGAGQIAYIGTVGAAETFMPGVAQSPLAAPWQSAGPREAIDGVVHDRNKRIALNHYQVEAMDAAPPPGYASMNEARRDKLYMSRAKQFVFDHPSTALHMAIAKVQVYVMRFGTYGAAIIVLSMAGSVLLWRSFRVWPLVLAAVLYSASFILIIAYYDRYRSPVEPLLVTLAAAALATMIARLPHLRKESGAMLSGEQHAA